MIHRQATARSTEYQQTIDRLRDEVNDAREALENCIIAARAIDPDYKEGTGEARLAWAHVAGAKFTHAATFAAFLAALEAEK
jgi:hypothetical protein